VLATPVAGVPDVVRDGTTGVLVTDTAPAAIAAQIAATLGRDDLAAMSHAACNMIEKRYSYDAAVFRYKNILSDIERHS
jgi:glycosyltransferase involved in cell wall biosynthesis